MKKIWFVLTLLSSCFFNGPAAAQIELKDSYPSEYTVKRGDTLWDISREYDVTIAELATWNKLKKNSVLRVGQKLTVYKEEKSQLAATQTKERTITYKVRRGDSLARIAAKFNVSVQDIIKWNSLAGQKYIQPGQKLKLKVDVRSA